MKQAFEHTAQELAKCRAFVVAQVAKQLGRRAIERSEKAQEGIGDVVLVVLRSRGGADRGAAISRRVLADRAAEAA